MLAAKDGDGDACYLLSRCFSGSCYSWEYHPFEENEAAAYAMLHQAISLGSAAAVLGALRMGIGIAGFGLLGIRDGVRDLVKPDKRPVQATARQFILTDSSENKSSLITPEVLRE